MNIQLNGFALRLSLRAACDGHWMNLPLLETPDGCRFDHKTVRGELRLQRIEDRIDYRLRFSSAFRTRLRLGLTLDGHGDLFHLIPGNIHGDNNAAHVRPGEFPCLTAERLHEKNRAPLWEFCADRASHPVSVLCCDAGAVGMSIQPYSSCPEADGGYIRNGVLAALPNVIGVSAGYGNDPLTFVQKTHFASATAHLHEGSTSEGSIFACPGRGRLEAHRIIRFLHGQMRQVAAHRRTHQEALRALADAFATVNWSAELGQYTNRKCRVPVDTNLLPWRAIVEIGWTGGSMLAYPFALAQRLFPDLNLPMGAGDIFDRICSGYNQASGFIDDTTLNCFTQNRPPGWNASEINGWWSGFLPQTRDNHCAYTNAHAAYYMLRTPDAKRQWTQTALAVLDTAVDLQREDGAFGYVFGRERREVIDWDGFAGCWFAAALPLAWKLTGRQRYRDAAERAMEYYSRFVRELSCWGTPMDTCKSVDSEGNLAFIRAARLLHEHTGQDKWLEMLRDGAHYEYLWRYGFRSKPQCPPLEDTEWNSCGGSLTSVSNPHIHPMSVVATQDLHYLARVSGDDYHRVRAEDGLAWLMNTMELYPDVVGYGRYGVLSERTCPSDGLLAEQYHDDGSPASTWWSYNAWAAGSAMEALAEQITQPPMNADARG